MPILADASAGRAAAQEEAPPLLPPAKVGSPQTWRWGPCSSRADAAAPSRSPWLKLLPWCRGAAAPVGLCGEREREGSRGGVAAVASASGRASAAGERLRAAGGRRMDRGAGGQQHWVGEERLWGPQLTCGTRCHVIENHHQNK
jgi:hypothetical protein